MMAMGRGGHVETEIMSLGLKEGIWATLFIFMLIYVLKTSGDRERKLIEALKDMGAIKEGVKRIEDRLNAKGSGDN